MGRGKVMASSTVARYASDMKMNVTNDKQEQTVDMCLQLRQDHQTTSVACFILDSYAAKIGSGTDLTFLATVDKEQMLTTDEEEIADMQKANNLKVYQKITQLHPAVKQMADGNVDRKDKYLAILTFLKNVAANAKVWANQLESAGTKKIPGMRLKILRTVLNNMNEKLEKLEMERVECCTAKMVKFPKLARTAAQELMENIVYNSCVSVGAENAFQQHKKCMQTLADA